MGDEQTPLEEAIVRAVDQALDLFVYAPLGLALTARDRMPDLVARGKAQVQQQTTLAKMMGEYAVREAEKDVRGRVARVTRSGSDSSDPTEKPGAGTSAAPAPVASPATSAPATTSAPAATPAQGDAEPLPSSDHLAIPGYDTLSASQVVQRLAGLSPDELEAVKDYEAATRGRRTILTKANQLQSGG